MWVGWESELPGSLATRGWLPQRPEWLGDLPPLVYKSKHSGSLSGIPLHWACIQRDPAVYLLVQNTHSQDIVPWVPEEQARGRVILNPASSQLLACWLVPKGQRSPSSVIGWFTLDIILRQMLLFLYFVITLDLGSVGGWGKSVLEAGCSCPVP